jgi:hypothetical protein
VVLVISGAISSYHKSITINQINTLGTSLVDDMRLAVSQSSASKLSLMCDTVYGEANEACLSDSARRFVSVTKSADVASGDQTIGRVPVFGAFCTGSYSYIWNSGYFFNSEFEVKNVAQASLKYNGDKNASGFKLLKVKDEDRAVCVAAVRVQNNRLTDNYSSDEAMQSEFNIALSGLVKADDTVVVDEEPLEMIGGGEDGMAFYDLNSSVFEQKGVSKNLYYYTSFILGTVQGGINVNAGGDYCQAPEDYSGLVENFDYCAINKFNFAALASGRKQ